MRHLRRALAALAGLEAFQTGGAEAVDGVGDEATFDETFGNLAVRSGDTAFEIQLNEYEGDVRAAAVELAEGVLAGG